MMGVGSRGSRRIAAMTVFSCVTCQQRISPDLREVPMPPLVTEESPGHRFLPPLMPRGSYAISPHTGVFILNPDDVSGVVRHHDRGRPTDAAASMAWMAPTLSVLRVEPRSPPSSRTAGLNS